MYEKGVKLFKKLKIKHIHSIIWQADTRCLVDRIHLGFSHPIIYCMLRVR